MMSAGVSAGLCALSSAPIPAACATAADVPANRCTPLTRFPKNTFFTLSVAAKSGLAMTSGTPAVVLGVGWS